MRVIITCEKCGATKEVHLSGGWDIENVVHQCKHDFGLGYFQHRELKPGEIAIAFDPPRRGF